MIDFSRSGKDFGDGPVRRRENHASQEAGSGSRLCFVHDPFQMLFDGVFAQVDPVRDFFVGKSEHEINDDHLLTFGEVIALLHVGVWAFESLVIQLLHDDKESAVSCEGFIGNTESA